MRVFLLVICIFACSFSDAQTIFSHEKKIEHQDMFNFKEIEFINSEDNLVLSGTLITPKSDFEKVVVILPGSGKDTRYSHYKLAQNLLENKIAVYRFDERGVGKSQGKFTTSINGLTFDLAYCIRQLKSQKFLKNKQIGVIGHSLGGMASIVAQSMIKDTQENLDFLVQVASPVKSFSEASKYQIKTLEANKNPKNKSELLSLLDELLLIVEKNKNSKSDIQIRQEGIHLIQQKGFDLNEIKFWSYAHIDLYKHDYELAYKALNIPTFYIIGSKDKYVEPTAEIKRLQQLKNPKITTIVLSNLNHYLTVGDLNSNSLYEIDKTASDAIVNWIQSI